MDHLEQAIEPDELLAKHGVHALVVVNRVRVIGEFEVENRGMDSAICAGDLRQGFLLALTPPPLVALPCVSKIELHIKSVSCWSFVMSALAWRPKTSGSAAIGICLKNSMYDSWSPSSGA